jgi:hypothetical protein
VSQNNVLCIRPDGQPADCQIGFDHDFGPKNSLIGGTGQNERNVIGPTRLNSVELSKVSFMARSRAVPTGQGALEPPVVTGGDLGGDRW